MVLFSLLSRICINNFVFTFETNTFSNDFWAMWYIETVYFSHEIKLVNADLIFKYLFFSWFVNYFCIFLKYFSYPHDSGKVLWIHVCQFISLSLSICPSATRFSMESLVRLCWFFCMVTGTNEYKRIAEPDFWKNNFLYGLQNI